MKREKHRCKRCGRRLTNPIYKRLGFGKVCYEKAAIEGCLQHELPLVIEKEDESHVAKTYIDTSK